MFSYTKNPRKKKSNFTVRFLTIPLLRLYNRTFHIRQ